VKERRINGEPRSCRLMERKTSTKEGGKKGGEKKNKDGSEPGQVPGEKENLERKAVYIPRRRVGTRNETEKKAQEKNFIL